MFLDMKVQNALLLASVALATVFSATAAQAGGSVSASASVSVTILAPVTLQATQVLDFGAVIKPGNAGANTVAIDPDSHVTVSGAGDAARSASAVSAAKFDVIGEAGITYTTTQSLMFDQPGLTHISASAPRVTSGAPGIIPASGRQELRFGGAFDISAATPAQAYSGALTVTVNYN